MDPDALFPWVAVCFVIDDGRVLLVEDAGHDFAWEPPGGKGERRSEEDATDTASAEEGATERPFETAERETREETGVECDVVDLLFTETLRFDYGGSLLAPVLQAGFVAWRTGSEARAREDAIESVDWFSFDDLPEGAQFRDDVESLASNR
jgi:8-oxo-dGTP pyrophosphatase MutT (NUDIX family)